MIRLMYKGRVLIKTDQIPPEADSALFREPAGPISEDGTTQPIREYVLKGHSVCVKVHGGRQVIRLFLPEGVEPDFSHALDVLNWAQLNLYRDRS